MAKKGKDILVYKDGVVIAATKTTEIQTDVEIMEVNKPVLVDVANDATAEEIAAAEAQAAERAKWVNLKAGRKSWSVTVGFLLMSSASVRDALQIDTVVTLKIKESGASDDQGLTGQAILKTCSINLSVGTLAQGSFQFVGTGPLE